MRKFTLTTKLNIEIVCIVVLLMLVVTAYNHYLYWQIKNDENALFLETITEFLVKQKPAGSFAELAARQGCAAQSVPEQVLAINEVLQPYINNVLVPMHLVKFGYYSRQHESIVAIGPQPDPSLLVGVRSEKFQEIYATNTPQLVEKSNSVVWHGATIITHIRPIQENGVVIGHAFASINQDAVMSTLWRQTLNTFLGAFLMLLVCVAIFRELFVRLKANLKAFAEAMFAGNTDKFVCEIEELAPLFQYISEETAQMTRLDRLNIIGEMAAGIAHEVRNPMTTVRGMLQFMSSKREFSMHKDNFELMIDEIDRANSIISEFLSLAKDRAMEFTANNLNNMIRDIYPLLQTDALRNNCQIDTDLGVIPDILADQNSIRQLILNMVRNGIDAMPEGGLIKIRTGIADAKVVLSIEDQGIGIAPGDIGKLGTPFFTTKETGTGLGLAVCYRIVQRHAATIAVNSEQGKGTIFMIRFDPIAGIPTPRADDVQDRH